MNDDTRARARKVVELLDAKGRQALRWHLDDYARDHDMNNRCESVQIADLIQQYYADCTHADWLAALDEAAT